MHSVDLLVIGTSVDPHISAVLQRLGGDISVCRLDVDRFPREQAATLAFDTFGDYRVLVHEGNVQWDVTRPKVAWFRRLGKPGISKGLHPAYLDFATGEVEQTIEGLLSIVRPGKWFNDFWGCRKAGNKPLQYLTATEHGLNLPDTLITNSANSAREWIKRQGEVVAKTISRPILTTDKSELGRTFAYTHRLTREDIAHLAQVATVPCQFQPLIKGRKELRVTTVGEQHFAVEVFSSDTEPDRFDWRATATTCEYRMGELDLSTAQKLTSLLEAFSLPFAASDFIVGEDGTLVFLESNPHGAWMWLEAFVPGLDITGEVARWIQGNIEK
ncbi:MvdC/MvdD family ATP grasp protein [Saccharothrix sp. HUAS TT1]|uniref:MvdC/MvdD family ATP grasp protein n=1 Tax=unclassified Saccharothrix TaxID=2593673 RepID=UPI00345BC9C4